MLKQGHGKVKIIFRNQMKGIKPVVETWVGGRWRMHSVSHVDWDERVCVYMFLCVYVFVYICVCVSVEKCHWPPSGKQFQHGCTEEILKTILNRMYTEICSEGMKQTRFWCK